MLTQGEWLRSMTEDDYGRTVWEVYANDDEGTIVCTCYNEDDAILLSEAKNMLQSLHQFVQHPIKRADIDALLALRDRLEGLE